MNINLQLAQELGLNETYVNNVIQLLDEGNTIPFIARYRKEMHGAMDDTTLRTLHERLEYLRNLDERRETIINSITEQGKMTEELAAAIDEAKTLAALEDLYRPYKQKRRTRATVAKEKGLEPLALLLYAQAPDCPVPEEAAVVKRIFREYLEGASCQQIAKGLEHDGVLTARGNKRWHDSAIRRILENEKYMGDALLQKTYTVDFLKKKRSRNNGDIPQYYVEDDHEAIIPKERFMKVQ